MGPIARLSNAIASQINEQMGSAEAGKFIEFASANWPEHLNFVVRSDNENSKLKHIVFEDQTWTVPVSTYWSHLHRMSLGYHGFILRKYSMPGFCEVEDGDIVLDCGSFIGGFASACAAKASRVVAVEPSPVNSAAAKINLTHHSNVHLVPLALWNESTILPFNISETAIDDGLLDPDHGAPVERVDVEAVTVAELARRLGIERFDFMKIEAEGVELEILKGDGGIDCNKIAIDCSPERGGQSPEAEITDLLHRQGFETKKRGIVVFGRKRETKTSITTVLQTSTATEPNRYPEVFDEAKRTNPDAKSILSYGCSEGDELQTIADRWPDASITGVDILQSAREKAKRRFPYFRILSPADLANETFDMITAMSVLCKWPEDTGPLPFPLFENTVLQIDSLLKPGGLLVVWNATYNPMSVLSDYEPYPFQPKLNLPSNSKSRRIVLPRMPNGNPAESPHPVLFRKPVKPTRPRIRPNTQLTQPIAVTIQRTPLDDRVKREVNHIIATSGPRFGGLTEDQVQVINKVLTRQITLAVEAQQQVSRLQTDLGNAVGQIEALKNSTSWRITAPIRTIKSALISRSRIRKLR